MKTEISILKEIFEMKANFFFREDDRLIGLQ
jgi:hypothetical protein